MLDSIVFRSIFILILGLCAGYFRPNDEPYWSATLTGIALGLLAIVLERRIARISLQRLIGVVFGVTAGLLCAALVSLVVGHALAWELVHTFLAARFCGAERHRRRLAKVAELERRETR